MKAPVVQFPGRKDLPRRHKTPAPSAPAAAGPAVPSEAELTEMIQDLRIAINRRPHAYKLLRDFFDDLCGEAGGA